MNSASHIALAAALALSAAGTAQAQQPTVLGHGTKPHHASLRGTDRKLTVLYDQTANPSGTAIVSQNFESTFDAYDSAAADDFTVPAGAVWKLKEVDVLGVYFNGSGPASSEDVVIFKDKNGDIGKPLATFANVKGTDNGTGSFAITLPKTVKLKAGVYWLSVVANMSFSQGGEWGWELQNAQNGDAAMWENPANGSGANCTTWTAIAQCEGIQKADLSFTLKGSSKAK
jgi:hypothetical protein